MGAVKLIYAPKTNIVPFQTAVNMLYLYLFTINFMFQVVKVQIINLSLVTKDIQISADLGCLKVPKGNRYFNVSQLGNRLILKFV